LNVALCDERQGKIASAHAKFSEARDRAKEQQLPEYIDAAQEHLDKLGPELPYLTLTFTEAPLPETKIVVDEQVIPMTKIARLPIDPGGDRVIVVSAPGRLPFTRTVRLDKRGTLTVEIPPLAKSVTQVVTSSRRTIGKITLASGAGVTLGAVVIGLVARSRWNAQLDSGACTELPGGDYRCSAAGESATNRARTIGTVGTVTGVVGLAAVGVGTYLWLTGPRSTGEAAGKVGLVPQVSPGSVGITAVGRF
jgi:hypothetical protein